MLSKFQAGLAGIVSGTSELRCSYVACARPFLVKPICSVYHEGGEEEKSGISSGA